MSSSYKKQSFWFFLNPHHVPIRDAHDGIVVWASWIVNIPELFDQVQKSVILSKNKCQ